MNTFRYLSYCLCALLTTTTTKAQTTQFNYPYDQKAEVPDTAKYDGTWYLPIQTRFVDFYNERAITKYEINPQDLNGLYRDPGYCIRLKLMPGDVPAKTRYFVDIASEGVGFEGYAIVNFLKVTGGHVAVDASYGSFANNSDHQYASSFYHRLDGNIRIRDSIIRTKHLDEAAVQNSTFCVQYLTKQELQRLRNKNNLYFGVVPHEVVTRSFQSVGHHILLELRGEQYLFRLFTIQNRYGTDVKTVTRNYLYGGFQDDWRFLFNFCTYRESAIYDNDADVLLFDTKSYLSTGAGQPLEQYLFPHLEVQQIISNRIERHRFASSGHIEAMLLAEAAQRRVSLPLFIVSVQNSVKNDSLGDKPRLFFDTSTTPDPSSHRFQATTILGEEYDPVDYFGSVKAGVADGFGELDLRRRSETQKTQDFFYIRATFVNGKPDGLIQLIGTPRGQTATIMEASIHEGIISGVVYKYNAGGSLESKAYYKDNDLVSDSLVEYHQFDRFQFADVVPLNPLVPRLSDVYIAYVGGTLMGLKEPYRDATRRMSREWYMNIAYTVYVRDSTAVYQLYDRQVIVPFVRDYATRRMIPTGKVYANYTNGAKMVSNWDSKYLMGGPSLYYWPQYPGWYPTQVTNGNWTVSITIEKTSNGFWDKLGNVLTDPITEPFRVIGPAVKYVSGKEDFRTFGGDLLNVEQTNLGDRMQVEGDVVHFLGDERQKLLDFTWPAIQKMADFNSGLSPITGEVRLIALGAHTLGIHNPGLDKIAAFLAMVTNFRDTVYYNSWRLIFHSASTIGTIQSKFGRYLVLATGGFPKSIVNTAPRTEIKNPSLELRIASNYLQHMFANTFDHEIPVNKEIIQTVAITGPKIVGYDPVSHALTVGFSGGEIKVEDDTKIDSVKIHGRFTIDGCNIEILPDMNMRGKKTYLDLRAVITYLKLKNSNPIIDRTIAWAIQDELLNTDTLGSLELTNYLNRTIVDSLQGKRIFGTDRFEKQVIKDSIALEQGAWDIGDTYLAVKGLEQVFDVSPFKSIAELFRASEIAGHDLPDEVKHLNCTTWPVIKDVPVPSAIATPDMEAILSGAFMKRLIGSLFKQTIEFPFSGDVKSSNSNHFISLRRINELTFEEKNVVLMDLTGDIWFRWKVLGRKLSTKFTIRHLNLYIVPTIIKRDTAYYLNFNTQIKKLDVPILGEGISKCLANFINYNGYLNNETANIDQLIKFHIESPLEKGRYVSPKVKEAEIVSDKVNYYLKVQIE